MDALNGFPNEGYDGDKASFNAGIEHLRTIVTIEREIDTSFVNKDYDRLHTLLDLLWAELYEWFDRGKKTSDEKTKHNNLRQKEWDAHKKMMRAKNEKKATVPREWIECYWERYLALKDLIHSKGLRMRKADDPSFALGGRQY
jgi:hypothetical protein